MEKKKNAKKFESVENAIKRNSMDNNKRDVKSSLSKKLKNTFKTERIQDKKGTMLQRNALSEDLKRRASKQSKK